MRSVRAAAAGALLLSAAGCIPTYVVPEPLERQVDRRVSFSQLKQDAERFKGTSVVLGGEVLDAKILPEGTQVEVLHLPLDAADRPAAAYNYSGGRFLLIDPERKDPVVLRRRLVTVVGEVLGTRVQKVDEADYTYPYLSARFIHVWRGADEYPAGEPYPSYYPYYPPSYYYHYYYPYGPYYRFGFYYGDPFFWYEPYYYYDYGPSHHDHPVRRFESSTGEGAPRPSPSPGGGGGGGGGGGRRFK